MILYIKHIDIEGPGTFGEFFAQKGLSSRIIEMSDSAVLPDDTGGLDAVISLGGPMSVYDEDKYPFLKKENAFIQKVIENRVPFMGLCLGSQLLAKASGAQVTKSPQKEIGFFPVALTEAGREDSLFEGVEPQMDVYQWHEDMSRIPEGAVLLATSQGCPHQAFRVGDNAYGIQFHVEITDKSIREWSAKYFKDDPEKEDKIRAMLSDYEMRKASFDRTASRIYQNFMKLIDARRTTV